MKIVPSNHAKGMLTASERAGKITSMAGNLLNQPYEVFMFVPLLWLSPALPATVAVFQDGYFAFAATQ